MSLYVVVGDGTLPKKELTSALDTLKDQAIEADEQFWVALVGKEKATASDKLIVKWLEENDVFWAVVGVGDVTNCDAVYADAQVMEEGSTLQEAVGIAIGMKEDDDKDASLLVLMVAPEGEDPADDPVLDAVAEEVEEGVQAFLVNGGMIPLEFDDEEEEDEAPEAEPEEVEEEAEDEAEAEADEPQAFTDEEIAALSLKELKALASSQGITITGRTKADYVAALTGKTRTRSEAIEPS